MASINYPVLKSKVGDFGFCEDPVTKAKSRFCIQDEVRRPQMDNSGKIIVLQKLKFDDGRHELRLGYYIIGRRDGMKGKWTWGQFAILLPMADFIAISEEARNKPGFLEP